MNNYLELFETIFVDHADRITDKHLKRVAISRELNGYNDESRAHTDEIRRLNETDVNAAKLKKKDSMCWWSCHFEPGKPKEIQNIIGFSGVFVVDVDMQDNLCEDGSPRYSLDDMKSLIAPLPGVLYVGASVRAAGVYAVIRVGSNLSVENYYGYYKYFERMFDSVGLKVDASCKNPNRCRWSSYDNNAYCNPLADVIELSDAALMAYSHVVGSKKERVAGPCRYGCRQDHPAHKDCNPGTYENVQKILRAAYRGYIDIAPRWGDWFRCGCSIANTFGESGRVLFMNLSLTWEHATGLVQMDDPAQLYNRCLNAWCQPEVDHKRNGCNETIGFFFRKAGEVGLKWIEL